MEDKPEFYKFDIAGFEDYRYATNIIVTNSDREFYITFVCNRPYETPRCVGRIVVGEQHVKEIIAVLGRQLEIFLKSKNQSSEGFSGNNPRI